MKFLFFRVTINIFTVLACHADVYIFPRYKLLVSQSLIKLVLQTVLHIEKFCDNQKSVISPLTTAEHFVDVLLQYLLLGKPHSASL